MLTISGILNRIPFITDFRKPSFERVCNLFIESLKPEHVEDTYVIPFDTGLGKSTLICNMLAEWKAVGFIPDSSILIAVATLNEIEPIIGGSSLEEADYAVFTGDDCLNRRGLKSDNVNRARVLFTTHSMIRSKLKNKKLAQANEFYFAGARRTVVLWDETFDRAKSVAIKLDKLRAVIEPLRRDNPELVLLIESLNAAIDSANDGDTFCIPGAFKTIRKPTLGPEIDQAERRSIENVIDELREVSGKSVCVTQENYNGKWIVGAGKGLPSDLAPMFVFDASARVSSGYRLWAEINPNVRILEPLVRGYKNLRLNLCKRACGLGELNDPDKRGRMLRAFADLINKDPDQTLLISHKERRAFDIAAELRGLLDDPSLLSFCNWGRHHGTNAFRDIKRIFVIGSFPATGAAYQARYMAYSGKAADEIHTEDWRSIIREVQAANLLQGISRGNLRNGQAPDCGECEVYMFAPQSCGPETLLKTAFPGCTIAPWEPFGTRLKGQSLALCKYLEQRIAGAGAGYSIAKSDVRAELGLNLTRLGQLLKQANVLKRLTDGGITIEYTAFRYAPPVRRMRSIAELAAKWRAMHKLADAA